MASPKSKSHRATNKANKQARRPLLLRRAMLHSCLCFLVGLLTGLAPSDWTDAASRAAAHANAAATKQVFRALHAVRVRAINSNISSHHHHWSWKNWKPQQQQPQVLVVVTATGVSTERERRSAGLTRTAHALRLVSPPVVWLVVEAATDAPDTALLLRRTGVVYRHITYKDNFSSSTAAEEERRLAMGHIEQHRLRGVVLFAGLGDVYDLRLLEKLRQIRTFGAWAVATVWDKEKRVAVQGPAVVCNNSTSTASSSWLSTTTADDEDDLHGFAFSTDLLLDPARWDRFPTSEPDHSQDSIKFLQRLLLHDDRNKTTIQPLVSNNNCSSSSEIMACRVDTTLLI